MKFRRLKPRPSAVITLPDDQLVGRFRPKGIMYGRSWNHVYVIDEGDRWCRAIVWSHEPESPDRNIAVPGFSRADAEAEAMERLQQFADEGRHVVEVVDREES